MSSDGSANGRIETLHAPDLLHTAVNGMDRIFLLSLFRTEMNG